MAKEKSAKVEEAVANETQSVKELPRYTKTQLVNAKKYGSIRDIVDVVVGKDETLTIAELDTRVDEFLKRKVK